MIKGIDSAGNESDDAAMVTASVSQPPDYILRSDIDSDFSGTKTNVYSDGADLFANVNTTQTWKQHHDAMSWTTLQDKVTAGYDLYGLPAETSGSYVQEVDYGTVLAGTRVVMALTAEHVVGTTSITPTISVKEASGDSWTDFAGSATNTAQTTFSAFATTFRFVKYTLAFSSAGNDDLLKISALNLKLEQKQKGDSGRGLARVETSGTYSQSGTTITLTQTGHGRSVGEVLSLDFTSGTATDGIYKVETVPNANTITMTEFVNASNAWVTISSATTSGNVTFDAGGTAVSFNTEFVDIESITITPSVSGGANARIAIYDFVDAPNPKTFKAILFNSDGDRVGATSGTNFSWQVRGA